MVCVVNYSVGRVAGLQASVSLFNASHLLHSTALGDALQCLTALTALGCHRAGWHQQCTENGQCERLSELQDSTGYNIQRITPRAANCCAWPDLWHTTKYPSSSRIVLQQCYQLTV